MNVTFTSYSVTLEIKNNDLMCNFEPLATEEPLHDSKLECRTSYFSNQW